MGLSLNLDRRDIGLDVARGVAVLLMIAQHFYLMIVSNYISNEWVCFIFFLLGTVLVAPIFLFIMGINTLKSKHNQVKDLFKRGLFLVVLGYLLSFFRFFLPLVLAQHFNLINNLNEIIYHFEIVDYLLEVDIFQVAGLSLIFISFLKLIKVKSKNYLVIAILFSLISPILWLIKFNNTFLNLVTNPFWGTANYVAFPFFSWVIYPLLGVYFGEKLLQSKNKTKFYQELKTKIWPFGIVCVFLFFLDLIFLTSSYSRHYLGFSLMFVWIILVWLTLINLNYQKINSKIIDILTKISKNITVIYIIQWLIIGWLAVFINLNIF